MCALRLVECTLRRLTQGGKVGKSHAEKMQSHLRPRPRPPVSSVDLLCGARRALHFPSLARLISIFNYEIRGRDVVDMVLECGKYRVTHILANLG